MNTAALKEFARSARRQLMEAVALKLDVVLAAQTPDYLSTFAPQVSVLRKLAENRGELVERVAYAWFNRFTALRYLDARGWHPFNARVLTPASREETQPELLKLSRTGALPKELQEHTDSGRLNDLLDGRIPSADPQGEVYRHLVLAACRFYHALLPDVFERLDDETELLLPDDLLTEHSLAQAFRTEITDGDCAEVEIIGWLYQFYISERKDEVMGRKSAVPKEDIPAVTQLFTPHWIVRYLAENSLGRLWLLNRPNSRLREKMPYYIDGEQETDFLRITKPEEIRVLDPAVGSGHMLTYAFDLLYAIYEEEGYAASDIPALILKHNLHGLEICPRAAQLAELSLLFKAREKSTRFFQPEYLVRPNVMELREVRFTQNELSDYIIALDLGGLFNESLLRLMYQFEEAKNLGSLIPPCLDEQTIAFVLGAVRSKDLGSQLFLHETHNKVLRVLEQAEALTPRYEVVATNPPYMGSANLNATLKIASAKLYPHTKADLFAMFVERGLALIRAGGQIAYVTLHNWMFLSSFTSMRENLVLKQRMSSCVHIGYNSFPELNSKVVQAVAFVIQKVPEDGKTSYYFDLNSSAQSSNKEIIFQQKLRAGEFFRIVNSQLKDIPGSPLAYWASDQLRKSFVVGKPLGTMAKPRQGLATGENARFVRCWHEISRGSMGLGCEDRASALRSQKKWFPYNKGGDYRRWYGNHEFVIDWSNDGHEIRNFTDGKGNLRSVIRNPEHYFEQSVSWNKISSGPPAFRYFPQGFIFDVAGMSMFGDSPHQLTELLGLCNSIVVRALLATISPTLNLEAGHISNLPVRESDTADQSLVTELVQIARADWDNFESSWNFRDLPLLRQALKGTTLEASWRNWEMLCAASIRRTQELETENNRIFIDAYALQDELSSEVAEEQITLARADARRDMAAFLSYAVGCMMGRYSLDYPGLILANGGDSLSAYLEKVGKPVDQLAFVPDEDGIIPILDGEWFEDDIVARTREFLRATFGDATLRDNIRFIEDSLGKDLRKYFLTDFYRDHLQTYKKRPIYWMFQSPRKGFSVLIYLHRYTRDTMNLVLNKYLREYQVKLRSRLDHLTKVQTSDSINARDKTAARKEADKLLKTLHDCEEWERQTILPLAQARIELDLDDGVKANYLKLGEALAPIPGLAAEDE